jgi:hypothetical protein
VTGTTNSGDNGGTTDRPVIDCAVVGRNTGRGRPIYDSSPFLEKSFALGSERYRLDLRGEGFNILNHGNFVGYSGTYATAPRRDRTSASRWLESPTNCPRGRSSLW